MNTTAPTAHHDTLARLARAALRLRALLLDSAATPTLGDITLLPHQHTAANWLHARLTRLGGALLADPPGLGKTYTALAVAARRSGHTLVLAPAALRDHWRTSAHSAGVHIEFISIEQLSAPATPRRARQAGDHVPRLVIIDEAHHLRTPATRRHQRTARLCLDADVLLLSATPIHNTTRDLTHITRLFHQPAEAVPARRLIARLTLRRSLDALRAAAPHLATALHVPATRTRQPLTVRMRDSALPDAILALPPLRHGAHGDPAAHTPREDGHALVQLGLLHALRSSSAAARERIHHRIAFMLALEHAALAGVDPTPQLQRAFVPIDHDVQLALPALLATTTHAPDPQLAASARTQRGALEQMLALVDDEADARRARVLRRLARWSRTPVVAFTWSTTTARALCHHLRDQPGIALLTGTAARIASGSIAREDVLRRLLPHGDGAFAAVRDRVRLLVTTDVLSEGLSLSGVTTIVHLDLPWTMARLDQRTGRAVRIGARVAAVQVTYLPAPLPRRVFEQVGVLLARKQRAMQAVAGARHGENEGEAEAIALLSRLSRAAAPVVQTARRRRRWHAVQHPGVVRMRIIALVRLGGARRLVVLDGERLRAPVLVDWELLATAAPARPVPWARQQLREALQQYEADRECSDRVARAGDVRQRAREAGDEALWRNTPQARVVGAERVSGWRREVVGRTRPGELEQLALALPRPRGVRDATVRDGRVRIVCGIVLVTPQHG